MSFLIGFDKNRENVEYKGHAKLSINLMSNYLYVEPENEEFKLISASFKWNFIMKNNFLFVFAEHDFLDFCLVFKNEQICKKIFDYINSTKKNQNDAAVSIDVSFINPIFQAISNNPQLNLSLIETIAEWYQLLEGEEKETYSNLMKEKYDIFEVIYGAAAQMQQQKETMANLLDVRYMIFPFFQFQVIVFPQSKFRRLLIWTSDKKDSFHEYKCVEKSQINSFKCITCGTTAFIDVNEKNAEICVKLESKNHSCLPSKKIPVHFHKIEILQKPAYEIFQNLSSNAKKILVVFDSSDRSQCYEYFWDSKLRKFLCRGCINKQYFQKPKASIFNEGTEKEYIEVVMNHQCQKRKFQPEKFCPIYEYILQPHFEIQRFFINGKEGERLIIFDKNNKSKCYQYFSKKGIFFCRECKKKGKAVSARKRENFEGVEYIILSNVKHVCETQTYKSNEKVIYRQFQDFEFMEETKNGNSKIFLFDKNNRKNCYIFTRGITSYCCVGCQSAGNRLKRKPKIPGRRIAGYLMNDAKTGDYLFQMKANQRHICEPKPYQPERHECKNLPKIENFTFFRKKTNPDLIYITMKHPESPKLGYLFYSVRNQRNAFCCSKCSSKKFYFGINLRKNANEKEYFEHDIKRHVCQPLKLSTICEPTFIKLPGSGFEEKPKQLPKKFDDESKIVKRPYFELRSYINKNKVPGQKLIIRHPTDKTLCYEYYFHKNAKSYRCSKCSAKNISVTAKLHKDDDENSHAGESYILLGKNEHVCQPSKFQSLNDEIPEDEESKIVRMPNFELRPNEYGIPDQKLIILHPIDKTLCYEYNFFPLHKIFKCIKCSTRRKIVSAKLLHKNDECSNGESYILLGNYEHTCQPLKYHSLIEVSDNILKVVRKPNFELRPNNNGDPDKQLIILHPIDKSLCYEHYFCNTNKHFICNPCRSKNAHVIATLQKDQLNGEEYILMGNYEHVCQPLKFQELPIFIDKESRIVRMPNFELRPNQFGIPDQKLIIFDSDVPSLCYEYAFHKYNQTYKCNKCRSKKKSITAKLFKDENSNEPYILKGNTEHICEPAKYLPLVRKPNFEIRSNKDGIPGQRLIILSATDPTLCFQYYFCNVKKHFICARCISKKTHVIARLQKDVKNEEYILMGNNDHACQPLKYKSF